MGNKCWKLYNLMANGKEGSGKQGFPEFDYVSDDCEFGLENKDKSEHKLSLALRLTLAFLALVLAGGYIFRDKQVAILYSHPLGIKPALGMEGEMWDSPVLEANNLIGMTGGVFEQDEVPWSQLVLVGGSDCVVKRGDEREPPKGVTWEVPRRKPDIYYQADEINVREYWGLLTLLEVNYDELPPGQTCE